MDTLKADELFEKGLHLSFANLHHEAIEAFTEAIGYNPDFGEAFGYRDLSSLSLGNRQAAMNDYDMALSLDSSLEEVYFFRGSLFQIVHEHQNAIEDYTRAIALNKTFADAYYLRGICWLMADDEKLALWDLKFAAQLGHREAQKVLDDKGIVS